MSEGKVAPNEGLDWYQSEVRTVLDGTRPLGASLEDKLTVPMARKLVWLVQKRRLRLDICKHVDGTFEWAWATTPGPLYAYRGAKQERRAGLVSDRQFWERTGALFGYSPEDVEAFVKFQTTGEGCDCAQCFPAGPPTWRTHENG